MSAPSRALLSMLVLCVLQGALAEHRHEARHAAIMSERGPFTDDIPQFIECSFHDKQMLGEYFIASSSQHGRFFFSCLYF